MINSNNSAILFDELEYVQTIISLFGHDRKTFPEKTNAWVLDSDRRMDRPTNQPTDSDRLTEIPSNREAALPIRKGFS